MMFNHTTDDRYGEDHQVTEAGTMNFFVRWTNEEGKEELVTAPLDGTILPGVTRQALLDLMREWGEFEVTERAFTMDELAKAMDEGRVKEMFGSGTAATVSPVRRVPASMGCAPEPKQCLASPWNCSIILSIRTLSPPTTTLGQGDCLQRKIFDESCGG